MLETCRDLLIGHSATFGWHALAVTAISLILLFFGWLMYRLAMPHLIARRGG